MINQFGKVCFRTEVLNGFFAYVKRISIAEGAVALG
jgi:hypothetical protein